MQRVIINQVTINITLTYNMGIYFAIYNMTWLNSVGILLKYLMKCVNVIFSKGLNYRLVFCFLYL